MLKSLNEIIEKIINYVLPPRTDFEIVQKLSPREIECLPKAEIQKNLSWIHPLFKYGDRRVKAIIWELKYKDNTKPLETIGKLSFDEILDLVSEITTFDSDAKFLLIPIPITSERRSERGYNQSEYIGRAIIENDTNHILLYAPQWLSKTKETPSQSHSDTREDRIKNLLDSFEANPQVEDKYVILIDDVVTTGSTLTEARKELLSKRVKDVFAFTIAH